MCVAAGCLIILNKQFFDMANTSKYSKDNFQSVCCMFSGKIDIEFDLAKVK